jgi:hypothetical protein
VNTLSPDDELTRVLIEIDEEQMAVSTLQVNFTPCNLVAGPLPSEVGVVAVARYEEIASFVVGPFFVNFSLFRVPVAIVLKSFLANSNVVKTIYCTGEIEQKISFAFRPNIGLCMDTIRLHVIDQNVIDAIQNLVEI